MVTREHGSGPLSVDDVEFGLIRIDSHTKASLRQKVHVNHILIKTCINKEFLNDLLSIGMVDEG